MRNNKKQILIPSLVVLALIIGLNLLPSLFNGRVDLTQDKRYSLSPVTKQLLQNVEEPMEVFVFLDNEKLPTAFKKLQKETRELLRQFEKESNGKIYFRFENPLKSSLTEEERQRNLVELQQRGITATNVRVKTKTGFNEELILPGALINFNGKQVPVQLLTGVRGQDDVNQSIELLEYRFANAISKLRLEQQPVIGFSSGHDELSQLETEDLRYTLSKNLVGSANINLETEELSPDEFSVLIIAKPRKPFSEQVKFKVDQYLMNGGKIVFALDAMKMELDSLQTRWGGKNVAVDYQLELDDLLFKYGVRMNRNLVRDLQSKPIPIVIDQNGQTELFPWTFYPVSSSKENHVINQNIDPVAFEFVSGLDTLSVPNLSSTVLLSSSTDAGLVANPVYVDLQELRNPPPAGAFTQQNIPIAVLVEGQFKSLFQHRSAQDQIRLTRRDQSDPTSIVVISDGDVFKNTVLPNGESLPLGYDRSLGEQFGNQDFALNVIDYLIDPQHPLAARNKQYQIRLLNQTKAEKEKGKWQSLSILLPILVILLGGGLFTFLRKRKYS